MAAVVLWRLEGSKEWRWEKVNDGGKRDLGRQKGYEEEKGIGEQEIEWKEDGGMEKKS